MLYLLEGGVFHNESFSVAFVGGLLQSVLDRRSSLLSQSPQEYEDGVSLRQEK